MAPLRRATRTVPIVFAIVPDPVGAGFVESLARPGGNITGFTGYDYGIAAQWLELLKEIAPNVTRAAISYPNLRTARWNKFGRPALMPKHGVAAFPTICRWDEQRLAAGAKAANSCQSAAAA